MRGNWIILAVVTALVLAGCGGGGSSATSTSTPPPQGVTTASDVDEMVNLLEEDEELDGRYRKESKRCAAEGPRNEDGEACALRLEERLSRRFAADEAQMEKLTHRVGLGCSKALERESIFDLPDDNSVATCEQLEGK